MRVHYIAIKFLNDLIYQIDADIPANFMLLFHLVISIWAKLQYRESSYLLRIIYFFTFILIIVQLKYKKNVGSY